MDFRHIRKAADFILVPLQIFIHFLQGHWTVVMIANDAGFLLWAETFDLSILRAQCFGAIDHIVVLRSHFLVPAVCVKTAFSVQVVVLILVQGVETFVVVFRHELDAGLEFGA